MIPRSQSATELTINLGNISPDDCQHEVKTKQIGLRNTSEKIIKDPLKKTCSSRDQLNDSQKFKANNTVVRPSSAGVVSESCTFDLLCNSI